MAWFACLGSGGGSSVEPTFSKTTILDNSSGATSFTFDEDYHDYDFLAITFKNTSTDDESVTIVTPSMLDASFSVALRFTLNFAQTDVYATYSESVSGGDISWTKTNSRTCDVIKVEGISCTNKTVSETEIYSASALSSTALAITSQDSLFEFDYLFILGNSSDRTEVVASTTFFPIKYYSNLTPERAYIRADRYHVTPIGITVTENGMSAFQYLYVVGIKFS